MKGHGPFSYVTYVRMQSIRIAYLKLANASLPSAVPPTTLKTRY
jgi:hypothetical protein